MPSKKLQEYVEIKKAKNKLEGKEKTLKPYVSKLLRRAKRMDILVPGVSYYETEKTNINEDELMLWIKDQCSDPITDDLGEVVYDDEGFPIKKLDEAKFSKFCKLTIDMEKLDILSEPDENGVRLVDLSELPSSCYTVTVSQTIRVKY